MSAMHIVRSRAKKELDSNAFMDAFGNEVERLSTLLRGAHFLPNLTSSSLSTLSYNGIDIFFSNEAPGPSRTALRSLDAYLSFACKQTPGASL